MNSADQPEFGLSDGLMAYVTSDNVAQGYDAYLADSFIPQLDVPFVLQHLPPRGQVLDLGCGTGRFLQVLASKGFETVGIDLSDAMLQRAHERLKAAAISAALLKANVTNLACLRAESFDAVLCMFATLGMVQGAKARLQVLMEVQGLLRPGGRLLFHVHNRHHQLQFPQLRGLALRQTVLGLLGREVPDTVMPYHQGVAGLTMHLFTKRELRTLLAQAALRPMMIEPIFDPADANSPNPRLAWLRAVGYFVVAVKP